MPFTVKGGHLITFFQTENHDNDMSIVNRICEQKLESSLIKSRSEKLINSVPFGSGRRPT